MARPAVLHDVAADSATGKEETASITSQSPDTRSASCIAEEAQTQEERQSRPWIHNAYIRYKRVFICAGDVLQSDRRGAVECHHSSSGLVSPDSSPLLQLLRIREIVHNSIADWP